MSDKNYEENQEFLEAVENIPESYGKYVDGTVLHITPTEIQVDINRKQTGIIPIEEYSNDPTADPAAELKIGDKVSCIIMKTNDQEGTIVLSKRLRDVSKNWTAIETAYNEKAILEGKISDVVKGGVVAFVSGVRIFVPASQATAYKPADMNAALAELKGQDVRLKVIEIRENPNTHRKEAIGSIRAIYAEERKAAKEAFWSSIEVGKVYTGKVKSIMDFGCFVDLGATDGLLHRSEISWQRFNKVSDVVSVGDEIEVFVKNYDPEKRKISLGHKKAEDNPWEIFKNDYPVGTICEVEIANFATFGAFAHILPGIDGLIYIGEISDRRINSADEVLSIGQKVAVKITDIDFDKKRISLSIKQANEALESYAEEEYVDAEYDNEVEGKPVSIDDYVSSDDNF